MTLCVAAHCIKDSKSTLLLGADYGTENDIIGADIQSKIIQISDTYFFQIAGTLTRAAELVGICEELLAASSQKETFYKMLRRAVAQQKKQLADEIVTGELGISYDSFLDTGKDRLPDEAFKEIVTEIRNKTLGCSLLAIDFSDVVPNIYRIHDSGMVEMCDNFAAIGTGMYIAESILFLRGHHDKCEVEYALYNVYESMMLGARAPGVSDNFSVHVVEKNDQQVTIKTTAPEYAEYLRKQFDKFSLRDLVKLKPPSLKQVEISEISLWGIKVKRSKQQPLSAFPEITTQETRKGPPSQRKTKKS